MFHECIKFTDYNGFPLTREYSLTANNYGMVLQGNVLKQVPINVDGTVSLFMKSRKDPIINIPIGDIIEDVRFRDDTNDEDFKPDPNDDDTEDFTIWHQTLIKQLQKKVNK